MFNYYKVFLNDNLVGTFKDLSEEGAIDQAYIRFGSASRYTGAGRNSFTAIRL
jgi:ribosomal protein L20A (L18A)